MALVEFKDVNKYYGDYAYAISTWNSNLDRLSFSLGLPDPENLLSFARLTV